VKSAFCVCACVRVLYFVMRLLVCARLLFIGNSLSFSGLVLISFSRRGPKGLANQAMDAQRSWVTTSDDNHEEELPLPGIVV